MPFDFTTPKGLEITPSDKNIHKNGEKSEKRKIREWRKKKDIPFIFISSTLKVSGEKTSEQGTIWDRFHKSRHTYIHTVEYRFLKPSTFSNQPPPPFARTKSCFPLLCQSVYSYPQFLDYTYLTFETNFRSLCKGFKYRYFTVQPSLPIWIFSFVDLKYSATATALLGVVWGVYFVVKPIHPETRRSLLPFIVNFRHWYGA